MTGYAESAGINRHVVGDERAPQGRKSLPLCGALVLRIRWFDPIAEASELPDHFRSAPLLRLLGDCWAEFFVTETRYCAAIHNLEDGSFGLRGGVGGLIENSPHVAVALRRPVAVVHSGAFVVARAGAHPRGELLFRRKGRCSGTDFGNDLL